MSKAKNEKLCFVISPIGNEGSEIRQKSNEILDYVIKPAALECGYTALRADEISTPGIITTDVLQHVVNDPLVIADLSGHNPNVFYELALRHATKKPVIQLIRNGDSLPFDISQSRTIFYELSLSGAEHCKQEIVKQIKAIESDPSDFDNPISASISLDKLRRSEDPLAQGQAQILELLLNIGLDVRSLLVKPRISDLFRKTDLNPEFEWSRLITAFLSEKKLPENQWMGFLSSMEYRRVTSNYAPNVDILEEIYQEYIQLNRSEETEN